ncbi:hypothetical protein [Streptacidiphilus fuscans]|uniref:Uncharacterized protein n=1 Tax=Streptacidiphilus fuscans TaxID=2789292 RepID=A0A931AXY4_9ACTN|nr:hypothetical protein [Streptacidiphilus fuscans]MBF9066598.1 hypothetical protein [Streptacidiphilus fuscans]
MGGDGLRGRVLVIEGGIGRGARRFPPRDARPAPGMSSILAALAPQVLLAADGVDIVHLPKAMDADGIRAHVQACVRHQGPLLIHVGGHLVRDRRTGSLDLDLGGHGPASRLPWRAFAEDLRLRGLQATPDTGTLVIADLSAEEAALPQLRVQPSPLGAGLPLWAAVSPDPQQVGIFTKALVEALHGGQPGAGERLTPEQLQYQVHSVLRPETQVVISHAPGWQVFRNTSRRLAPTIVDSPTPVPGPGTGPVPGSVSGPPQGVPLGAPLGGGPTAPLTGAPRPSVVTIAPPSEEVTVEFLSPTATSPAGHTPPGVAIPRGAVPTAPRPLADDMPTAQVPVVVIPAAAAPVDLPPFDMPPLPPHAPTVHLPDEADQSEASDQPHPSGEPTATLPANQQDPSDWSAGADDAEPADAEADAVPGANEADASDAAGEIEPADASPTLDDQDDLAPYREAIGTVVAAAEAGEHAQAIADAQSLERQAMLSHGPDAEPVLKLRQVRAHVTRMAGLQSDATLLYRDVALSLLDAHGPEDPETLQAAANAEACWRAIEDDAEARRIGPDLLRLRQAVPDPRRLAAVERHLARLRDTNRAAAS